MHVIVVGCGRVGSTVAGELDCAAIYEELFGQALKDGELI